MSLLHCGHLMRSVRIGRRATSPSHALHWKCIIGVMRAFVVILLLATSVHAQSLADAARRERERREHLKSAVVIKADGSPSEANAKPAAGAAAAEKPKEPAKAPAVDPVKEYNDQLQKLRAKISSLQDQETATQLQINDLNNQIYAPVVDQATKDQAMAVLGEARGNLAAIRLELDQTRKNVEELQLQGPPKAPASTAK